MEVDIYIPCIVDQYFPDTGFNMVKVLERTGCKVQYNVQQTCCGMPAMHSGFWDHAREVGEKLLSEFDGERPIVCAGSACTGMIRNDYEELFQNTVWLNKYRRIKDRFVDLSEFLVDKIEKADIGASLNRKAVYQDACSAMHWCGIEDQPRKLLSKVSGLQILEIEDKEMCCGFGGSFAARFEPAATELARLKVDKIRMTGADLIITSEPGCLMHLQRYITDEEIDMEVMHIADVLAHF